MSTQSRRNVLAAGLAGLAGGLLAKATGVKAEEPEVISSGETLQADRGNIETDGPDWEAYKARMAAEFWQRQKEIKEVALFWKRLMALPEDEQRGTDEYYNKTWGKPGTRAYALPAASQPPLHYVRMPSDAARELPEPDIELLPAQLFRHGYVDMLFASELQKELEAVPEHVSLVNEIILRNPDGKPTPKDRICSPKFMFDKDFVEDEKRLAAYLICDMIVSVWNCLGDQVTASRETALCSPDLPGTAVATWCEATPLAFDLKADGFMRSSIAYTIAAGYSRRVTPGLSSATRLLEWKGKHGPRA